MISGRKALVALALVLSVPAASPPAFAWGGSDDAAEVSLPATLITEGAVPGTEI